MQQSKLLNMLDVIGAASQVWPKVQGLGYLSSIVLLSLMPMLIVPSLVAWYTFDLESTSNWTAWVVGAADTPTSGITISADSGSVVVEQGPQVKPSDTIAQKVETATDGVVTVAVVLIIAAWGFTLAPSLLEMLMSRFAGIPAMGYLVKAAVIFDFITDFPKMYEMAKASDWYNRFGFAAPLARIVGAAVGDFLASMVLQVAVVIFITIWFSAAYNLVMNGRNSNQTSLAR